MRPVGILGGMGPEATILLMQKCVAAIEAKDDSDHVPLIVHQNPQVPSRIAALIHGDGGDPAPVLIQMAQDLEHAGAKALAMPCNTAHHYAHLVAQSSPLEVLNMVDLTAAHLAKRDVRKVGMLASPAVRRVGVFDAAFRRNGVTPVYLAQDDPVLTLIQNLKRGAQDGQLAELERLARMLLAEQCDHLLIACTELSLLAEHLPKDVPWTDSLDCLVSEIVAFARDEL